MADIMGDRDPNSLNPHLSIAFEDVFGEPDTLQSTPCTWQNSAWCFSTVSEYTYKALTFICSLPTAFCWGCYFACANFCHIWYLTPIVKTITRCMDCVQKVFRACLNGIAAPCCEVCALCFSKIKVAQ